MSKIIIYTDGASRGNPGPGGWGAVVISENEVKELGGREDKTTNNKMELTAIIEALKYVSWPFPIVVYSDSEYAIKGMTEWIHGWQKRNWKNSQKKNVMNRDLWEKLLAVSSLKKIEWKHVRGHEDNPGNIRCDEIATMCADNENPNLYSGSKDKYPFTDIVNNVL